MWCSPENFGPVQKLPARFASKRNSSEGDFEELFNEVAEEHENENDWGAF